MLERVLSDRVRWTVKHPRCIILVPYTNFLNLEWKSENLTGLTYCRQENFQDLLRKPKALTLTLLCSSTSHREYLSPSDIDRRLHTLSNGYRVEDWPLCSTGCPRGNFSLLYT
ncbi:hypothetical protein Gasu2_25150 [Galdieria sulphuraria]|uniref:Uncharacterized protein n=1 Tax=Galdieria sulphuraria TaxID=130081 RepID=M2XL40_GALSU|nr:uncharacterized protein Gasu_18630 [Galdieria sulphuraria]EME30847.1 hypothetical protein Gasu_18630 [Galdieria sulphuraria]GJD08211.1 hypothetical protein Gasu2_25150 [Galdieria sulphuraria]|eukprot:XP_005707367.1 hypothetical protein Gasu_18630 [Galdieria sulphuraria]